MRQGDYLTPYAWGRLLSDLLEHRLTTYLCEADVETLMGSEARAVLYEQLRSFLALKRRLKSRQPRSALLRPAHEALVNFAARLFMAAYQTLLSDPEGREQR